MTGRETIDDILTGNFGSQNVETAAQFVANFNPNLFDDEDPDAIEVLDEQEVHVHQAQVHQEAEPAQPADHAAQPEPAQLANHVAQPAHALLPTEPLPLQQLEQETVTVHGENGVILTLKVLSNNNNNIGGKGMRMAMMTMDEAAAKTAAKAADKAKRAAARAEKEAKKAEAKAKREAKKAEKAEKASKTKKAKKIPAAEKAPRSGGKAPRGKPAAFAEKSRPPYTMEPATLSMPELVRPTLVKNIK